MSVFKDMDFHLTPAYGRDYKSKAAVVADWNQGKDFIVGVTGQYCSKRDLGHLPGQVWIRYNQQRHLVRVQ